MRPNRCAGFIRELVAIGLLTGVVSLTDQVQAASGNGPYYATPSWDQKLPAETRFVVLRDWNGEAVLDRNTGLVWEQSPDTPVASWSFARLVCINKNVGGQRGWRLPAVAELTSLIDPSAFGQTLPVGHPFTNRPSFYWSASSDADDQGSAWLVDFNHGEVFPASKGGPFLVWCVRGGSNADRY